MSKLELGAGFSRTPGFLTLDLNPYAHPDFVGSAYPLPTAIHAEVQDNGLFDELRAVDVLEHLSYRDTLAALTAWAGITRPGGRLYVQVPDAAQIMSWYANGDPQLVTRIPPELPQTPLMGATWRLLGGHADGECVEPGGDFRLNAHFALFTRWHLVESLEQSGWEVESFTINEHPNLCCWAVRV